MMFGDQPWFFLHYFLKLEATVENYFSQEISTVYSNGCEDQKKKKTFFATFGITHLLTQPHAPQHNGAAKSQHHHIVEIGLTLLHQVFMPVFCFSNKAYLVKRLPTSLLEMKSPFEKLYN